MIGKKTRAQRQADSRADRVNEADGRREGNEWLREFPRSYRECEQRMDELQTDSDYYNQNRNYNRKSNVRGQMKAIADFMHQLANEEMKRLAVERLRKGDAS